MRGVADLLGGSDGSLAGHVDLGMSLQLVEDGFVDSNPDWN